MGRKCNVEGCQSDSNRPKDVGVTFHKVPPHMDIRPKWLSLCRIPEDKKYVKVIYVCSRHFLRADFCNFKGKKYMLKQGVLPSVFPWDKSKLEAIKAEAKKEKPADLKEELSTAFIEEPNLSSNKESKEFKENKIKLETEEDENQTSSSDVKLKPEDIVDKKSTSPLTTASLSFTINSKVEALDFNNDWYPAKIIEIDYEENEVLIHFENFSSKYDEWISMNSSRLRPLQNVDATSIASASTSTTDTNSVVKKETVSENYIVGERCLAIWSDSRKFPASITKVLENDTYEVLFDDGFVKTVKGNRLTKSLGKPLQSSPLFDPIKSSKQDRREKKRKLNVAALFRKRPKLEHSEDKQKKTLTQTNSTQSIEVPADTEDFPQTESPTLSADDIENWKPSWYKGKPVGIEATLQTQDGPKLSYIVPDPRLPSDWNKHLLRRTKGCDAGKWDTVIVSPGNKRFRSKTDILKYLEEHPDDSLNEKMFDFSLVSKRKSKKSASLIVSAKSPEKEQKPPPPPIIVPEEPTEQPEIQIKEEDNSNSLKILFENDAYKCPIEGCGKNFRRENLAQMHVKHYHPEYTKFLDSTPNVADLAYARTVGENLDRSPGPQKPALKAVVKTSTPKTPKHTPSFDPEELPDLKPPQMKAKLPKSKDQEIIKLLNAKPYNKQDVEVPQEPIGPPYPDLKLKDLLTKSESIPNKDDASIKNLMKSKPSAGIKTLLPVHRPQIESSVGEQPPDVLYKPASKRKCVYTENIEIIKGIESGETKSSTHTLNMNSPHTPSQLSEPPPPPPSTISPKTVSSPDFTSELHQSPSRPFPSSNNVIIEGGEVIKIVRMKQEEIINCTCGFMEEDGLMIQCELCLCWQHAYCNNIERESQVPDKYVCYICQNPLRERISRKYYHDQDWLTKGTLPVGSYHTKDEEVLQKRFEKLKKCHDLSGGLFELGQYQHSLKIKTKIAEAKNHPKLYLWSKPWPKHGLPEKAKLETENTKSKLGDDHEFLKNEFDVEKESQNENSMLMMILKAGKNVIPKLDLNSLMDNNSPIIPQPEAVTDSADCRLNLLEHLVHQYSLVEERLDDFEKQIDLLEEGASSVEIDDYPKTRATMQMLMRDLETINEFSHSSAI